ARRWPGRRRPGWSAAVLARGPPGHDACGLGAPLSWDHDAHPPAATDPDRIPRCTDGRRLGEPQAVEGVRMQGDGVATEPPSRFHASMVYRSDRPESLQGLADGS